MSRSITDLERVIDAAHQALTQDRRPRFTLLPGGGGRNGQVRPVRSHVTDLRAQHAQAVAAGHPSALPPYDHTTDPDRPVLPSLVLLALDRVGHFVRVPGGEITRAQAVEALDVVARWARPDLHADDCPARGIERPVLS